MNALHCVTACGVAILLFQVGELVATLAGICILAVVVEETFSRHQHRSTEPKDPS